MILLFWNFLMFILQILLNYLFMIANVYVFLVYIHMAGMKLWSLILVCTWKEMLWPNRRFELGMPADSCMPAIEPIKI